ncbi:MAG TPA: glucose-6-phosphate dehydrogenase assembly protein OpcA [bacterium]|nr:glucose-6-phosphate dehydrogenase assembly protein OpcA [bacterium]
MSAAPEAPGPAERMVLSGGQVVDLARIDSAFSALWRQAVTQLGPGQGENIVRACLWNVVVYSTDPAPDAPAAGPGAAGPALQELLDEVTLSVPSRVIWLRQLSGGPPPGTPEVQAEICAHCIRGGTRAGTVSCEQVTLTAYGQAATDHFPALVRALLVPDLPMALVWQQALPRRSRLLSQLLRMAQRLLVDSHVPSLPGTLIELNELVRGTQAEAVDLGWSRLTPVRYLLASMFDPPGHAENLKRMESVEVLTTVPGRNQGLLLLGWLLSRCGYATFKAVDLPLRPAPPEEHYRWQVRQDGKGFPVHLSTRAGVQGRYYDGILGLVIQAGGERYSLERVDEEHVVLESANHHAQRLALHGWGDAELMVAALGSARGDPLYREALAIAASLMDTEAWNQ